MGYLTSLELGISQLQVNYTCVIKKLKKIDTWTKQFINDRTSYLKKRDLDASSNTFPIQPSALFKELRNVLPKNSAIITS